MRVSLPDDFQDRLKRLDWKQAEMGRLYRSPSPVKGRPDEKLLSEQGLRRVQAMTTSVVPQKTLYCIDKIVRLKLSEEEFKLAKPNFPTESESIPEGEANSEDIPEMVRSPEEEKYVTPPTRVSRVPRFRSHSQDGSEGDRSGMKFEEWFFKKETERKLKEKLIKKVK